MSSMVILVAMGALGQTPGTDNNGPRVSERVSFYPADVSGEKGVLARQPDLVLRWNDLALALIKTGKTPPPIASRTLAILHAAMFDAVNGIQRAYEPFHVQEVPPAGTSPEAAAIVAGHRILIDLYPKEIQRLDETLDATLGRIPEGSAKTEGMRWGQFVAEKILASRDKDGSRQTVAFTSPTLVGLWQPTPPGFRPALLPQWGKVTPFAMKEVTRFRPAEPPLLTSAEYKVNFEEVKSLGELHSSTRTAEQTEIAKFWADGEGTVTPPGHWNKIAQGVAVERNASLLENARLFALLNLTLADAAILCWDVKFHYNFWRPVAAIRCADWDANPDTIADRSWIPLLDTPPFPSYTSGHSTFSGSAAALLAGFWGSDQIRFKTTSDGLPGVTRSFAGFTAAAAEAGKSRIYGGIHYQFDNTEGLKSGKALADYVLKNLLQPRVKVQLERPRELADR